MDGPHHAQPGPDGIPLVRATPAALEWIATLVAEHGPVMFHQSGGSCDGSTPMCFPDGEFLVSPSDVLLGEIGGAPFYIGKAQWETWKHTRLTIDVVPGRGSGFSLEAPHGVRFVVRSEACPVPASPREPSAPERSEE